MEEAKRGKENGTLHSQRGRSGNAATEYRPGCQRHSPGGKAMKGIETPSNGGTGRSEEVGQITCSTIMPPANIAPDGVQHDLYRQQSMALAVVEVQVKSRKDMISIGGCVLWQKRGGALLMESPRIFHAGW